MRHSGLRYLIAVLTGLLILTVSFEACHSFTTVAQVKGMIQRGRQ